MSLTHFELVMLENGEIALQRADGEEPLVCIKFSPEVLDYLGKEHIEVAKCMIDAGIHAVSEWSMANHSAEELFEDPQTLH